MFPAFSFTCCMWAAWAGGLCKSATGSAAQLLAALPARPNKVHGNFLRSWLKSVSYEEPFRKFLEKPQTNGCSDVTSNKLVHLDVTRYENFVQCDETSQAM